MQESGGNRVWVNPLTLFNPARLDLLVKYRYFKALVENSGVDRAETAYRKHISIRTGGVEPNHYADKIAWHKNNLDEYVVSAKLLLSQMREQGFDQQHGVPIGSNGLPLNGAHRIACAAALGLEVCTETHDIPGIKWDFEWFFKNGYSKDELADLLFDLSELTPSKYTIFVLWAPTINQWDIIVNNIATSLHVAGHVDMAFSEDQSAAFFSLVYDMYSYCAKDHVNGLNHIDAKIEHLRNYPNFFRVGLAILPDENYYPEISVLKSSIRSQLSGVVSEALYITCHFADDEGEARHLSSALLNSHSMKAARQRRVAKPRTQFLEWISAYIASADQEGIDLEDCCIVGSSILEIQGIRRTTDIDFTVRKHLRESRFGPGITKLVSGVDIVTEQFHRTSVRAVVPDEELILNPSIHLRFRGLKVSPVSIVKDRKDHSRRPKDLLDVELIEHWEKANSSMTDDGEF